MEFVGQGLAEGLARLARLDPDVIDATRTSLIVSGAATALSLATGVPLGAALGLVRFRGRRIVLSLVNTGMGLPPVVVGLFVAVFIWRSGPFGDLNWYCTRQAMISAQYILAAPPIIGLTAAAMQSLDPMLRTQVEALGASRLQLLWIVIGESRLLLLVAAMAGFGEIISEIGASLMVGCNIRGETRILSTAITLETGRGEFGAAFALAFILLGLIFVVNLVTTSIQQRRAS
jgi:tungstate transport system permease protein